MSVLEDFWYGNIEPSEYDTSSAKEYKEALLRISRNEESLQDTLTDAQRELFAQYLDSVREVQDMAECLLFQNSFRLGGPLREFCVSDFRQNQEYHVFNVQDEGLFPLVTSLSEGWDGMRAVCGVNAGPARRESCFKGISPLLRPSSPLCA